MLLVAGLILAVAAFRVLRATLFPELPTVAEGGVPGYDYTFWFGLFGPKGLPQPIVDRLFEASRKVLKDPALRKTLETSGNEPSPSASPAEFAEWAAASGAESRELTLQSGAAGK